MNVLVTGGAGYIGSHTVEALLEAGHQVTVIDDLSNGHHEAVSPRAHFERASLADAGTIQQILRRRKVDAVLHFAAFIEVGESVQEPGKYFQNNFSNTLNLLQAMRATGANKIVFSSTAAVYGNPESTKISESHSTRPINPYGRSKLMVEMALEDFSKAHGFDVTVLRYFNVAGASPRVSIGEAHTPETHLIPLLLESAASGACNAKLFGSDYDTADGSCVRDYVHVDDLARAHILAAQQGNGQRFAVYNVGSEAGFSVREVISAVEKVTGKKLNIQVQKRREGDPARLVADSTKIRRELQWQPVHPELETMIQHAWAWHSRPVFAYTGKKSA